MPQKRKMRQNPKPRGRHFIDFLEDEKEELEEKNWNTEAQTQPSSQPNGGVGDQSRIMALIKKDVESTKTMVLEQQKA